MPSDSVVIAVDVGNSRIKVGRFHRAWSSAAPALACVETPRLPEFTAGIELQFSAPMGEVPCCGFESWSKTYVGQRAIWLVASVHRGAANRLELAVERLAAEAHADWPVRRVTWRDVPMTIDVDEPERVGIDRLLSALAADRVRAPQQAAIVVDVGSAITVDLVTPDGAFAGGAILPGLAMSARALDAETDALPLVSVDRIETPPAPLGKSTVAAIESGLLWGAVGAVRELIARLSAGLAEPPEVIVTGGGAKLIADCIVGGTGRPIRHVPYLVLAGIALVDQAGRGAKSE